MIIEALDIKTWVEIYICNLQEVSTLEKCALGWVKHVWAEGSPHLKGALPLTQCQRGSPLVGLGCWVRRPPCLWVNQAQPRPCSWDPGVSSVKGTPWAGYQPLVLGLQRSCVQLTESSQTPPWAPVQIPANACCLSHEQGPVSCCRGSCWFLSPTCLAFGFIQKLGRWWKGSWALLLLARA